MAIICVLAAIAVPSYLGLTGCAVDSAAKASIRATLPSAEAYFLETGHYVGITAGGFRSDYDAGLAPGLAISGPPSASSYCLTDTEAGHAWSVLGPGSAPAAFKHNSTCS